MSFAQMAAILSRGRWVKRRLGSCEVVSSCRVQLAAPLDQPDTISIVSGKMHTRPGLGAANRPRKSRAHTWQQVAKFQHWHSNIGGQVWCFLKNNWSRLRISEITGFQLRPSRSLQISYWRKIYLYDFSSWCWYGLIYSTAGLTRVVICCLWVMCIAWHRVNRVGQVLWGKTVLYAVRLWILVGLYGISHTCRDQWLPGSTT